MFTIKIAAMIIVFLFGVSLVLDGLSSVSRLWLLLPGCILLVISYPAIYYYFNKLRFGYKGSRELDALKDAQQHTNEGKVNNGKD